MELTPQQQSLVCHQGGHALCIAVPGSGKTSTLAHRIKALLVAGACPQRVLVMMFNKSAQLDFTDKLNKLCQDHALLPEVRTYHSTGLRLLRNLEKWGLRAPYNPRPLSDKEIELKVRELLLASAPDSLKERIRSDSAKYIEAAISFIEAVKSSLSTPDIEFERADYPKDFRFFIGLFHNFEQWRHDNRNITFTDMLYDTVCLIEANPDVLPRIENKMNVIVVDEYQDTSTLQHRLTQIIAGNRAEIMAVGDPDQTIYEFAGANINNILHNFEEDFGSTGPVSRLSMPHTFRYGHSIALAASHLISRNKERKDVICIAHSNNAPSSIELTRTERDDTQAVLAAIRQYLHNSSDDEPMAILVRVWAQAVPIELNLLEQGIPYLSEGPSLFDRPEISALTSALELAAGQLAFMEPIDREKRLQKMLTLPHIGIKTGLVHEITGQLKKLDQGYGEALNLCSGNINGISDYQRKKLQSRARVFQYLERAGDREPPAELLKTYLMQTEFRESLQSMSLNDQRTEEQLLAVDGLLSWLASSKQSVRECCFHIQTLRKRQQESSHQRNRQKERITLSSCHRAKGLEWPIVLIPGLTEKYWPFIRDDELAGPSSNALEAERRLLYVAMTRARKRLHLFTAEAAQERAHWAQDKKQTISPFLTEMQVDRAIRIAELLHGNEDDKLTSLIASEGLTTPSRRYLKEVKPDLSDSIDKAESPDAIQRRELLKVSRSSHQARTPARQIRHSLGSIVKPDDPWQMHARISHAIFGSGKVIEVNDSNFVIHFDGHHGVKRFARNDEVKHLFCLEN